MLAMIKIAVFLYYAYSFLIGGFFVAREKFNSATGEAYQGEDVLAILIAFITGFIALVSALPNIQAVVAAKIAAKPIFDVIDRVPRIKNVENATT